MRLLGSYPDLEIVKTMHLPALNPSHCLYRFLDHSDAFSYCSESQYASLCSGKQVAVRISFANFVFFAAHCVLLLCCVHEDDVRAPLHTSLWFWKLLAWAGTIVGFFFVPSSAMVIYAQVRWVLLCAAPCLMIVIF